jgi:hypothetical protein
MASFMTKKKKYKFQVGLCVEELLEVPLISAVLFAKIRLLDGGSFQDHSTRLGNWSQFGGEQRSGNGCGGRRDGSSAATFAGARGSGL